MSPRVDELFQNFWPIKLGEIGPFLYGDHTRLLVPG